MSAEVGERRAARPWSSAGYLLLDSALGDLAPPEELFDPEAADPRTLESNAALEALCAQAPAAQSVSPEVMRSARREGKGVLPAFGPLREGRWIDFKGSGGRSGRVRVLLPDEPPKGVFLHFHGGGWTFGAPDEFDGKNLALAGDAGIVVASARYRLAPEWPWPAALEDCLDAYAWVCERAEEEFGVGRFAVGGDSAGGHLAAATLLAARAGGMPSTEAAVLTYGCFDLRMTPSMANWGERALVLSTPSVEWFIGNLLGEGASPDDPLVSPLLSDLAGMPPALFTVGTLDPLLDDSLLMARKWAASGSPARLAVFPGGVHAFDLQDAPIARAYRRLRASFLADVFEGRGSRRNEAAAVANPRRQGSSP